MPPTTAHPVNGTERLMLETLQRMEAGMAGLQTDISLLTARLNESQNTINTLARLCGNKWLSPDEVAEALGITAHTVRERCNDGTMEHTRVGSNIRIPATVLSHQWVRLSVAQTLFGLSPEALAGAAMNQRFNPKHREDEFLIPSHLTVITRKGK